MGKGTSRRSNSRATPPYRAFAIRQRLLQSRAAPPATRRCLGPDPFPTQPPTALGRLSGTVGAVAALALPSSIDASRPSLTKQKVLQASCDLADYIRQKAGLVGLGFVEPETQKNTHPHTHQGTEKSRALPGRSYRSCEPDNSAAVYLPSLGRPLKKKKRKRRTAFRKEKMEKKECRDGLTIVDVDVPASSWRRLSRSGDTPIWQEPYSITLNRE